MNALSPRAYRYLQVANARIVRHPPLVYALEQLLDPPKLSWRLSEWAKHDIVRRYKAGQRIKDIAAIYDIAPQMVCYHARQRRAPRRQQTKWNPK